MIKIKAPNWKKVSKQMQNASKFNKINIQKGLNKAVIKVSGEAARQAPVKTGTLRRSITQFVRFSKPKVSGRNIEAKVGSRIHYAIHQEMGTKYIRPKKFLINAIEKNRSYISKIIGKAMAETIRKA